MQIQQEINQIFTEFSDNSKVWIYQSNRTFTEQEVVELQQKISMFINSWSAHGKKVHADGKMLFNRFIVLVADEKLVHVSGCSIDSSVQFIKQLQQQYQVDFFDRFYSVFYFPNEEFKGFTKMEMKEFFSKNHFNIDEVKVFNNTIYTLKDLKTKWFVDINTSWQSKLIFSNTFA